jgi:hypothetical protein
MERIVTPNKKENMLIEAVKDHHSERDGSGYKSKKISDKDLEPLVASIVEMDKRGAMSHMDVLLMLANQGKRTEVYQVIEGTVLESHWTMPIDPDTISPLEIPPSYLSIQIESNSPVKKLEFHGHLKYNPFWRGEKILAAIPKTHNIEDRVTIYRPSNNYYKRKLESTEAAETIKVIKNNKVVATYQNL